MKFVNFNDIDCPKPAFTLKPDCDCSDSPTTTLTFNPDGTATCPCLVVIEYHYSSSTVISSLGFLIDRNRVYASGEFYSEDLFHVFIYYSFDTKKKNADPEKVFAYNLRSLFKKGTVGLGLTVIFVVNLFNTPNCKLSSEEIVASQTYTLVGRQGTALFVLYTRLTKIPRTQCRSYYGDNRANPSICDVECFDTLTPGTPYPTSPYIQAKCSQYIPGQ